MNRLESLTEKKIREAIENGEFADLPGKGEPINLQDNPFEDPDLRVVHHLLRNAGFAPAWIEERKDIDAEFEKAQTNLMRAWALFAKEGDANSNPEWQRSLREFLEQLGELNRRIRIYNLKAPAAVFHRRPIDGDEIIQKLTCNANC